MKKIIKYLVDPLLGRRLLQPFYEALSAFAIAGMNIGRGGAPLPISGELSYIRFIRDSLRDKTVILFDVGANVGEYTKALRKEFGEGATIYVFEPSRKAFSELQDVCTGDRKTYAHNIGLSNAVVDADLYTDKEGSVLGSLHYRDLSHEGGNQRLANNVEKISLITLDEFCAKHDIHHIDFLKIDVEGHELHVFEGAMRMLNAGAIDYIQFEFGQPNVGSKVFFQELYNTLKEQYEIYRIVRDGLRRVPVYKDCQEIFMCTNFAAIRKEFLNSWDA